MLGKIDEDEKRLLLCELSNVYSTSKARNTQEMWFLTEDGLYEVLMQSRKPIAKMFKKEVKLILKQIRQTGGYIPVNAAMSDEEFMAKALMIAQNTLTKKDQIIAEKERIIEMQQPKVDYHDKVVRPGNLITITDIAKDLGMSGTALNRILCEKGIIYKRSNSYKPYAAYQWLTRDGYADYTMSEFGQQLKWTELELKKYCDFYFK